MSVYSHAFDSIRPYDDSMWDRFSMYDNMPYKWDSNIEKKISLISGNLIKSYRCVLTDEPYMINN